ncbi:esterase-like activity of phytase family protein, partial [Ottowia sp.]|uniref:esterase-like activity of phytase family protein n=1 Tax=Ottowia sp. TaxID=1898956 RepID=UPI0039E4085C
WPALARADDAPAALRLLAHGSLPAGGEFKGAMVGGLSGLAHDPSTGLWYALSDDRGRHGPVRCHVLRLPPPGPGRPLRPEWVDVITLRGPGGRPFPRGDTDPEALALRHDPASGRTTLLWASEGNVRARVPPALYESVLDGTLLREIALPPLLRETGRLGRGPRNNEALEGLAITPDGRHAWVAMESALAQDEGPGIPGGAPGACRFTRIDLASGRADRQVAYPPEPLPFGAAMPHGPAESGVAEILMRDERRLWVLERAWTPATGVSARLYEAALDGATDTLGIDSLRAQRHRPCAKRLRLDLRASGLPHVDNFEAMAWGPPQADGRRTLVLCTDDNFNPLQVTQFAAFEVAEP